MSFVTSQRANIAITRGPCWSLPSFGLQRFFAFLVTIVVRQLHSQSYSSQRGDSPSFRLPFKEGLMSFHADDRRSDSVAMAVRGANSKSLHCFATGGEEGWGDGERRVEPALCPSQRRQKQQVVGILRFLSTLYDPTLAPQNPGQRRSRCARHLCQPDSKVSVRRQRLLMNQKPASCTNPPPTAVKGQLMNLLSVLLSV